MRHLRLQDEGARRGPAAPLHRGSPALRPPVPGAAALAPRVSDRDRPRLPVGARPGPREWLPRAVRLPLRPVSDRRRGRPRARASAALRRRCLAQLTARPRPRRPERRLVPLDTARPGALVTPLHRAAREPALSPADVREARTAIPPPLKRTF